MLKKIAAAVLAASLVPAAALACGAHKKEQAASTQPEKVLVAQKLDMKELQKMGNNASSQIKKDSDKVQLDKKLESSTSTKSNTAVKKRPNAKQVSQPKK